MSKLTGNKTRKLQGSTSMSGSSCCSALDQANEISVNSCCSGSTHISESAKVSCCASSEGKIETEPIPANITVTIDGKEIEVDSSDSNIVDVADRAKIALPAPCYRNNRQKGCCNACLVEINGVQKFACSTIPEQGMEIVINREDLNTLRKQRLLEYKEGIKSGTPCGCSGSDSGNCCY